MRRREAMGVIGALGACLAARLRTAHQQLRSSQVGWLSYAIGTILILRAFIPEGVPRRPSRAGAYRGRIYALELRSADGRAWSTRRRWRAELVQSQSGRASLLFSRPAAYAAVQRRRPAQIPIVILTRARSSGDGLGREVSLGLGANVTGLRRYLQDDPSGKLHRECSRTRARQIYARCEAYRSSATPR